MNKVVNRYLTQSMLLIAALTVLTALYLWLTGSLGAMVAPLCIVVVFQLVACLAYGLIWQSVAASSTASLPTLYLTASGARMFAGVVWCWASCSCRTTRQPSVSLSSRSLYIIL